MTSTRTKHFVGLLSGSFGVTSDTAGLVGNARAEIDIARIGLLFSYSDFISSLQSFNTIQVSQFNIMGGYSLFSSDELTWRVLAGLDIMIRQGSAAFGPVVGTNLRSMFGRTIGIDGAFMVTLLPFRQFEVRAALVIAWSIFEIHLGWRLQVIDATQSGTLATLFTNSPGINGPVVGLGLTF